MKRLILCFMVLFAVSLVSEAQARGCRGGRRMMRGRGCVQMQSCQAPVPHSFVLDDKDYYPGPVTFSKAPEQARPVTENPKGPIQLNLKKDENSADFQIDLKTGKATRILDK